MDLAVRAREMVLSALCVQCNKLHAALRKLNRSRRNDVMSGGLSPQFRASGWMKQHRRTNVVALRTSPQRGPREMGLLNAIRHAARGHAHQSISNQASADAQRLRGNPSGHTVILVSEEMG